jgi:hypothetical protein
VKSDEHPYVRGIVVDFRRYFGEPAFVIRTDVE